MKINSPLRRALVIPNSRSIREYLPSSRQYLLGLAANILVWWRSYPSLGAKADFHDGLIKFSYERQLMSDPDRTPYYFECLQTIADGRKSEDLQTLVAIEESSGKVSAGDIRKAYKALNLDLQSTFLDDDFIIGNFQSWVADAPKQESDLRRALQIIGHDRSSQKILSIASKSMQFTPGLKY